MKEMELSHPMVGRINLVDEFTCSSHSQVNDFAQNVFSQFPNNLKSNGDYLNDEEGFQNGFLSGHSSTIANWFQNGFLSVLRSTVAQLQKLILRFSFLSVESEVYLQVDEREFSNFASVSGWSQNN